MKERTTMLLENWIEEREAYDKYSESELLWLTQYENPYGSQALNRWFRKPCDEAGIDRRNRKLSWYSGRTALAVRR